MRTLTEIVTATRLADDVTVDELRYAVVAFDVLMSQLDLEHDAARLRKWFVAAEADPKAYAGPANDPEDAEAVGWYRAMIGVHRGGDE